MNSLRASEHGIHLVDQARRKKHWTKTAEIWCAEGLTSRSTLNRFWAKHPIRKEAFVTICQAVGVDWTRVVEREVLDIHTARDADVPEPQTDVPEPQSPQHPDLLNTQAFSAAADTQLQRQDWGDAPEVPVFYGRQSELGTLQEWVVRDRCRLLVLLGMGGMGKTTLAAKLARTLDEDVDVVIWRSLRNAPPLQELLADILHFLDPCQDAPLPESLDAQIRYLIHGLTRCRCLIVLDNAESILRGGDRTGRYRDGYEGYGQLFRTLGEMPHQSCLVITSREQPKGVNAIEGEHLPVRCLWLSGMEPTGGQALFMDKGLFIGSTDAWQTLIQHYAGNPLALKIVASAIRDFFNRDLSQFLNFVRHTPCLFDDISDLLSKQFQRLTPLEQTVMYWLAINREPISFQTLWRDCAQSVSMGELLQALASLQRRSLVERIVPPISDHSYTNESIPDSDLSTPKPQHPNSQLPTPNSPTPQLPNSPTLPQTKIRFTQQPVVMDYVTCHLIEQVCEEVMTQTPKWLQSHALMKAQAKDYIRHAQIRLILTPIIEHLTQIVGSRHHVVECLTQLLNQEQPERNDWAAWRSPPPSPTGLTCATALSHSLPASNAEALPVPSTRFSTLTSSPLLTAKSRASTTILTSMPERHESPRTHYLCGNVINLLQQLDVDFSGFDLSNRQIWQANFQGVNLHQVNLANADVTGSIFTQTLGNILSVAFSPDGQLLTTGSTTGDVILWNAAEGQKHLTCQGHTNWVWSVAFSPDGQTMASGSSDRTLRLWDVKTGNCLHVLDEHEGPIWCVLFSPGGDRLFSSSEDGTIKSWDRWTGQCLQTFCGHQHWVRSITISADGTRLASGSEDHTIKLWDIATGQCRQTLQNDHRIWSVAFSPTGQFLASSGDAAVHLWDVETGERRHQWHGHQNWIRSIAFCPEGRFVASASEDHTVKIWDSQTGQCCHTLQGHRNWVRSVAFSPDRQTLCTGSGDHTIKMWDIHTGQCIRTFQGYTNRTRTVALGNEGHTLVSGHDDHDVRIWNLKTGTCERQLKGHTNSVCTVAISPDGSYLASAGDDQTIRLWHLPSGQCVQILRGHANRIWSVTFSADQRRLISGSEDQTLRVWDVMTGQCLHVLNGHTSWICAVAAQPQSRSQAHQQGEGAGASVPMGAIASGSYDQTIKLWDLETGTCLRTLKGHENWVWTVAFSPDGQHLATGSGDHTIRIWDTHTGDCLQILQGHDSRVWRVAFSPDGETLASCSSDRTIRLWSVATEECRHILNGHTNLVWAIAFSPDGQRLVSGSQDETIKHWDLDSGTCLQTLRPVRPYEGMNITGIKGLTEAQKHTLELLGASTT